MKTLIFILFITLSLTLTAQTKSDTLAPYSEIPEAPEAYTAGTVISRMIDGLGFRLYWATEGLTEKDLNFEPGNDGRTAGQTMDHLLGLSQVIVNSANKVPNDRTQQKEEHLTFAEKRSRALHNLRKASLIFEQAKDLSEFSIVFKSKAGESEFPFWNNINGPIEDAIWHAGQIVVLRRSAGHPINPKVNVFLGKLNN